MSQVRTLTYDHFLDGNQPISKNQLLKQYLDTQKFKARAKTL